MAQQIVITGNSASDGTGDPVRTAFTKINENFTELYGGNVQITAANIRVFSVAGRVGNVQLSVSDINNAASIGYVNSAISSNIAAYSGSIIAQLNANINAANLVIADHESRIIAVEGAVATNSIDIDNLNTVKADITYVDNSIDNAINTSIVALTVVDINANITAANLKILDLYSNAAAQASTLAVLSSNAVVQATAINSLTINAASQSDSLTTLTANSISQQNQIVGLIGNTGILANNIGTLSSQLSIINSNITAANLSITSLQSNATTQSLSIDGLSTDIAAILVSLNVLGANAAAQSVTDNILLANAAAQAIAINAINANISEVNVGSINLINANITAANILISSLIANVSGLASNAGSQGQSLLILNANVSASNLLVSGISSTVGTHTTEINTLNNNINAANLNITNNTSNISSLFGVIALGNTAFTQVGDSLTAVNVAIDTKAAISGQEFTGNITAPYLLATANVKVAGGIEVGNPTPIAYAGQAGVFVGNVDSYYQLVIQNTNSGTNASGDIVITADDGNDGSNYINMGINGSNFVGPFLNTGFPGQPHDGYLVTVGGNLALASDTSLFFAANLSIVQLAKDGDLQLLNCNLKFKDNSTQTTAYDPLSLPFTRSTPSDWDNTVLTVGAALDELAARLRALNG